MTRLRATFRSLSYYNFRVYFGIHAVSAIGVWLQRVGQAWLVLELTGSGTLLGVTAALQHLPTLLVGPWGGLLADRMDKRRLLYWTEGAGGLFALTLALLVTTGRIQVWSVLALALALGTSDAVSQPAKRGLVYEMVGPALAVNALMLYSVVFNAAKVVGPAIAGALVATVGLATAFYGTAVTFGAFVVALTFLRAADLRPAPPLQRGRGQVREGLSYVRRTPQLSAPLLLMTVSGMLAYEWQVTLPLLAVDSLGGDVQTLGLMFSAMGVGAVCGGLIVAGPIRPTNTMLFRLAWTLSAFMVLVALSPSLTLALAALVVLGAASLSLRTVAMALLQIRSAPQMRGRVMALLLVALRGTSPIGAPLLGWVSEVAGVRFALVLGAAGTSVAALGAIWLLRRHRNRLRQRLRDGPAAAAESAGADTTKR